MNRWCTLIRTHIVALSTFNSTIASVSLSRSHLLPSTNGEEEHFFLNLLWHLLCFRFHLSSANHTMPSASKSKDAVVSSLTPLFSPQNINFLRIYLLPLRGHSDGTFRSIFAEISPNLSPRFPTNLRLPIFTTSSLGLQSPLRKP